LRKNSHRSACRIFSLFSSQSPLFTGYTAACFLWVLFVIIFVLYIRKISKYPMPHYVLRIQIRDLFAYFLSFLSLLSLFGVCNIKFLFYPIEHSFFVSCLAISPRIFITLKVYKVIFYANNRVIAINRDIRNKARVIWCDCYEPSAKDSR